MRRSILFWLLATVILISAQPALSQSPKQIRRIGYLSVGGDPDSSRRNAFQRGLRELGYVEGKNLMIEWRAPKGRLDRLDELAAELVSLKVEMLVTTGNASTRAAKKATSTTPIVTVVVSSPVENGFVASLARPGGNITGLTSLSGELSGKRVELLRDTIPGLSHLMLLGNSSTPGNSQAMQQAETVARALSVQLTYKDIQSLSHIDAAFKPDKSRADAAFMLPNAVLLVHRKHVVEVAAKNRLPMMYDASDYVQTGGLISYAADAADLFRRSSIFIDKILKGAKPADLPVEQPTKFELVVNLKAAKQIGLTIPPNVLYRADRVIK